MSQKISRFIYLITAFIIAINCQTKKKSEDNSWLLLLLNPTASSTASDTTSSFTVTTIAGSSSSGSTDGTGTAARFNSPYFIAVDSNKNLFVTDTFNESIRKITSAGVVTTFAGTSGTSGTTDATSTAARFSRPKGITIDTNGNLYVADNGNHTIRKITANAVVSTFAGTSGASGTTDATGTAAKFSNPEGITIDSTGNLFVVDSNNWTIRKVTTGAVVTTFAGNSSSSGTTDGTGTAAKFWLPTGAVADSTGNLFVTDTSNHTIRKITSSGVVTTFVGTAGNQGSLDGTGASASFRYPYGITIDTSGNLYVADYGNHAIRKITSAGVVTTIAGSLGSSGTTDGAGTAARFKNPRGITIDSSNNLYVVDEGNNLIRKIVP